MSDLSKSSIFLPAAIQMNLNAAETDVKYVAVDITCSFVISILMRFIFCLLSFCWGSETSAQMAQKVGHETDY